jgi:hypothetical protein
MVIFHSYVNVYQRVTVMCTHFGQCEKPVCCGLRPHPIPPAGRVVKTGRSVAKTRHHDPRQIAWQNPADFNLMIGIK